MPTMASTDDGVQPYKFGGKEYDTNSGLDQYDFHARQYDPILGRFTSMDPHAENYFSWSPYAYCANNPLKFTDPTGMDIYRYDDKSGEFILMEENDDKFDQVGQYKHDSKTGEYTLKTDKKGIAKTRIDSIEKGILSNGINFKEVNNIISVGGEGQPTLDGVQKFALDLQDMSGVEISGYELTRNGKDVSAVYVDRYKNNTKTTAESSISPNLKDPNLFLYEHFHTHSSHGLISERQKPSDHDYDFKNKFKRRRNETNTF